MSEACGCPKCAHLCVDQSFSNAQEFISWIVEHEVGKEDDDSLDEVYIDMPQDRVGMIGAFKCVACGQLFVATVGNAVPTATRKPLARP